MPHYNAQKHVFLSLLINLISETTASSDKQMVTKEITKFKKI